MAQKETTTLERTYNVPLRKEYLKTPNWKRTKKAVAGLRKFLKRHMKSEDIKLGKELNEKLWEHGIKNPPHHVKITATKDDKGVVRAELFGIVKKETKKEARKAKAEEKKQKSEAKKEEPKAEKPKQEA